MPNGMYGSVRGRKTKVGRKLLRFPPTRLYALEINNVIPFLQARIEEEDTYII